MTRTPSAATAAAGPRTRALGGVLAVGIVITTALACSATEPSATGGSTAPGDPAPTATATSVPATRARSTTPQTAARVTPAAVPDTTEAGEAAALGPVLTVPAGGITMSFRQFGSGPDLVLVGGQAAPMSLWPLSTLQALAEDHRVTIYDNRSLGHTTDDLTKPLTMEQMADDLAALTDALGLATPDLFGWSTGGEIALVALTRHPGRFGTTIVTGAMPGGPSSVEGPPENIAKLEDPTTPPAELLPLLFGPDSGDALQRFVADFGKVTQTVVTPETTARYAECEHAFVDGPGFDDAYRDLAAEVVVINGLDDQLVPADNARRIADLVPGSELQLEPGGHAWFVEHPDRFATIVRQALGD